MIKIFLMRFLKTIFLNRVKALYLSQPPKINAKNDFSEMDRYLLKFPIIVA